MEAAERDSAAVSRFVDRFSAMLTEAGMSRMTSRVFVQLLVTDNGRLTAHELAERLHVSAGSISAAIRYLTRVELVDREHQPGSRRDSYRVRADVWYASTVRKDVLLGRWLPTLRAGIDALGADTPAGDRLAETHDFFEFVQAELPALLERWNAHRTTLGGRSA